VIDKVVEKCQLCNSEDIISNEYSPEDKPFVIRTERTCKSCGHYWYEDN
jgi:hypothetical protein